MESSDYDQILAYTIRVELLNGKVLLFPVDGDNRRRVMQIMGDRSDGMFDGKALQFIWFESVRNRIVMIKVSHLARITFLFDFGLYEQKPNAYYDNFRQLEKETTLENIKDSEGEIRLHVIDDEYLPQVIIYHKGVAPDDHYNENPLTYASLETGCLAGFDLELDGDVAFRQFINLIDNDGEETFIPLYHIIVMEFAGELLDMVDDGMDEEEEENDETEDWLDETLEEKEELDNWLKEKFEENDELDNWLKDKFKEDEL
jgi:hypothetical protein